jgi:hypothetical protein
MTLAVVPVVTAVILTGGATRASATTCGDSWTNPSGGSWSAGGNWSSGHAPTSAQSACIVIATSAAITESGTVTAAGLTLGGTSGQTVLELAGTVKDSASSTISADGELTDDLGSNLDVTHGATLTNHGTVLVPGGQALTFTGKVTNASGGVVDVAAVGRYGGVLYLNGPGTFTNDGTLSAQTNASIDAPGNGTGPSVAPIAFYDEGGTFTNDGTVTISAGGKFKQRSTAISGTGAPIDVDGAVLDFTGSGGGIFTAYGTTELEGNMAHGQSVTLDSGEVTAAGSFTNAGLLAGSGTLTLPSGATLTNTGMIVVTPAQALEFSGNLDNAPSGLVDLTDSGRYGGGLYLDGPAIKNDGTVDLQPSSFLDVPGSGTSAAFDNDSGTIENDGTVNVDAGGTWLEGAGKVAGNPVAVDGGIVDFTGSGAGAFALIGTSELEGNLAAGQSASLQSRQVTAVGSIANAGLITGSGMLTLPAGATLTNSGEILVPPAVNFELSGNLDNTPIGTVTVGGTSTYGGAAELGFDGPTLTNDGTIAIQADSTLLTPDNGTSSTIDNDGGTIANAGTVTVDGGSTFEEGGGTTSGNPITVVSAGLDLTGAASSSFALEGPSGTMAGDIAAGQSVDILGPLSSAIVTTAGSFTNDGVLGGSHGVVTLPAGDTLTNNGTIAAQPGGGFGVNGNLTNTPSGMINISGNDAYGGESDLDFETAGTTLLNEGTIDEGYSTDIYTGNNGVTIDNVGTIDVGLGGNSGTTTLASSLNIGGPDNLYLSGTLVPVLAGGYVPTIPPPPYPSQLDFGIAQASAGSFLCGPVVTGGLGYTCDDGTVPFMDGASLVYSATSFAPTTTTVASSSPSSVYGQSVTFTATVTSSGPAPTGSVVFYDDNSAIGTAPLETTGGVTMATITTAALAPGTHPVMALYGGDVNSIASSSLDATQVVAADTTATEITTLTPSPANVGQAVTVTVTLTPSATGSAPLTGSVVFDDGTTAIAVAPVETSDGVTSATVTTTVLAAGSDAITATYTGDSNYLGSVSSAGTEIVTPSVPTAVTAVTPAVGTLEGGTKVTITGTWFDWTSAVTFGSMAATSYSVNATGTVITAYSPAEAAGPVDITVTTAAGTSATSPADQYLFAPTAVTAVSPTTGSHRGDTKVTITGTSLEGSSAVMFGSVKSARFSINAAGTVITAYSPAEAAGPPVDITVTTPSGTSATGPADMYTYT